MISGRGLHIGEGVNIIIIIMMMIYGRWSHIGQGANIIIIIAVISIVLLFTSKGEHTMLYKLKYI